MSKGHGTKIEDLDDVTYHDLLEQIEAELKHDLKKGRKIIVGGVSLGALFALIIAAKYPMLGVFDVCSPYYLKFPFNVKGIEILGKFKKHWAKHRYPDEKKKRANMFTYDAMHVNGLTIVKHARKELDKVFPKIKCPILSIHSYTDPIGHYKSLKKIQKRVRSKLKERRIISTKDHNVFYSMNNEEVYSLIFNFVGDNMLFTKPERKKLNIAFFSESYKPALNGVVQSILSLRESLISKGHRVFIFYSGKQLLEQGVYACPRISVSQGYGPSFPWTYNKKLFDNIDIFHSHQPFTLGQYSLNLARKQNKPFVITNHAQYHKYLHYVPFGKYLEGLVIAIVRWTMSRADKIVLPSKSFKKVLETRYGIDPAKIEVIPNGIIYPKKIIAKNLKENEKQINLIFTGRMGEEKNIYFLLDSFKILLSMSPNVKLFLVGGGPELDRIKMSIEKNGLNKHVVQTGYIKNEQVFEYLAGADIFVSASKTEIHPITMLEAMYCGLAIVALNAEGFNDTIEDSVDGYLVNRDDKTLFASKLSHLIKNPKLLVQMKLNAKKKSEQYTVENTSDKIEKLYYSLTEY